MFLSRRKAAFSFKQSQCQVAQLQIQIQPDWGMVRGLFQTPRFVVDTGPFYQRYQRLGDQDVVDAQAPLGVVLEAA